jgi:hypothetical protein
MKNFILAVFLLFASGTFAQVQLYPMPKKLSVADAQKFIHKNKKVWIDQSVNIGDLTLTESGYYIMMAGRTNVILTGNIVNSGNNFIGNGDITGTIVNQAGYLKLNCVNINIPKEKIGVDVAGGKVTVQTCRAASGKICMQVRNKGELEMYGGNYRSSSETHVRQLDEGHLHIFGVGFQSSQGIDVEIDGPSWKGMHYIEASRSENGKPENSVMLYVPLSKKAIDVYMRANSYTANRANIVNYNGRGKLYLVGNCNYANENKGFKGIPSILAKRGTIISIGNNYGNTLDSSTLQIFDGAKMESVGDMTRIDQKKEPRTTPIENIRPYDNVTYLRELKTSIPIVPVIRPLEFEPIKNLTELGIVKVEDYGASTNKDDNSEAISAAINSNKLVLLSGFYKVAKPVQISSHLGGGFWGIGAEKSGLISTSGLGCINVESMGYSHFRDFSLINDSISNAATLNFGWLDKKSSKGGSALQNTVFYNLKIVNGLYGMLIGNKFMGSELWIYKCRFIQQKPGKGTASQLDNYNALTDNYINCSFSGWGTGVYFKKGCGNVVGSSFTGTGTAVMLGSQVGNGLLFADCNTDKQTGNFLRTLNSSSRSAIILDKIRMEELATATSAGEYMQGGTVVIQSSDFGNRAFKLKGGIGSKVVIPDRSSKLRVSYNSKRLLEYKYSIDSSASR